MDCDNEKYKNLWHIFVNIEAIEGYNFNDLIDTSDCDTTVSKYIGAWTNILVKADTINEAIEIIPLGLKEKNFKVIFIERAVNLQSMADENDVDEEELEEADWLLSTSYRSKLLTVYILISQMKNEILNKSLLELGEWTWLRQPSGDDLQSDRLTMELDCLSKKKLCDYSNSDIYLAVSQEKGLRFTLPLAIRLIEDDILIECEFYEGDLLKAVLQIPTTYY